MGGVEGKAVGVALDAVGIGMAVDVEDVAGAEVTGVWLSPGGVGGEVFGNPVASAVGNIVGVGVHGEGGGAGGSDAVDLGEGEAVVIGVDHLEFAVDAVAGVSEEAVEFVIGGVGP